MYFAGFFIGGSAGIALWWVLGGMWFDYRARMLGHGRDMGQQMSEGAALIFGLPMAGFIGGILGMLAIALWLRDE